MSVRRSEACYELPELARSKYAKVSATEDDTGEDESTLLANNHQESHDDEREEAPIALAIGRFRKKHLLTAWHLMLGSGALAGSVVLLINLITLIAVYAACDIVDNAATIWTGKCSTASGTVTGLHLVITVLSSILLASSNFNMQYLSSPTREEVDAAHAKDKWLSIGTPNVRNLLHVSTTKALLWLLLGLSSFPLHLIWNSTVFETKATNDYVAVSATEDFLGGAPWKLHGLNESATRAVNALQKKALNSSLQCLENADCIGGYGQQFQLNRRNIIMVVPVDYHNTSDPTSVIALYGGIFSVESASFGWMCDASVKQDTDGGVWQCDSSYLDTFATQNANFWIPGGKFKGSANPAQDHYPLRRSTQYDCAVLSERGRIRAVQSQCRPAFPGDSGKYATSSRSCVSPGHCASRREIHH